jgi:hypothetical protein
MRHLNHLYTLISVIALISVCSRASLFGSVSIVYNIKIAETTKRQAFEKNGEHPSLTALTPFDQFRTKYSGDRQNYGGTMLSYIYSPENYFGRVDFAVAQVNTDHGRFVKTETDDLVFSGGYSFSINERAKLTLSGFFGVPTHKDKSIVEPQFGYAHVGLGAQLDGSLIFSKHNPEHSLRFAVRGIEFFNRTIHVDSVRYHFTFGALVDLYIALHINIDSNRVDLGYNPTFLVASSIKPFLPDAVKLTEFKRNSFFGVYKRRFALKNNPSTAAVAVSYGFDFEPLEFGNKRIITVWGLWTIGF